jgi:predicted flavoprotein YhiN
MRRWPGWRCRCASSTGTKKARARAFLEDLLFTHRGLSGPAVLQISSYWQPGTPIG